jgi:MFS family permease
MTPEARRSVRATLVAGGVSIVTVLPMFLTGGLAVQLADDLLFTAAGLGVAVAAYRITAAVTGPYLGRLADRLGTTWALRVAVLVASGANLAIAVGARSLASLVAVLAVGGSAMALGQPAANRLVSTAVAPNRRGIAFGVKQSANPTASTLAGLSVPVVALTLGWRWAYAIAALLGLAILLAIGRNEDDPGSRSDRRGEKAGGGFSGATVRLFFTAFLLAMAVGTAVPTFYVAATVNAGSGAGSAGTLLAVASVMAIVTRLVSGAMCDRMAEGHLKLYAGGLGAGVLGFLLLATDRPLIMGIGAVIALAGTWGFNGVFWYAVIRAFPGAPGQVTGTLLPGGQLGGAVGPLLLGLLIEATSYQVTWVLSAGIAAVASYAMLRGARRILEQAT